MNVPVSTVAATEAIAMGDATSEPSPNASCASSDPDALAGALKYDAESPPMPMSHFWFRPK